MGLAGAESPRAGVGIAGAPVAPKWPGWALLGAGTLAVTGLAAVARYLLQFEDREGFDFTVYRGALADLFSGKSVYDFSVVGNGQDYAFTYPPFAALVMAPLGLSTYPVARLAWVLIQYGLVALLVVLIRRRTPADGYGWRIEGWLIVVLGFCAVALNETVVDDVRAGQMSLAVVTLVLVDVLVLPPKWRGGLVGIAGAIKLTPFIFLVYFCTTRQWRALANAVAAAGAAALIALVVLPADSTRYWTRLVFETSRVGDPAVWRNKSLLGLLRHWGIGGSWQQGLWLALILVIGLVAFWQAWRHFRRGEDLAAALVVGSLSTVVSPISWVHHLVWIPLVGIYLVFLGRRWPAVVGLALLLALLGGSIFINHHASGLLRDALGDVVCLIPVGVSVLGLPRRSSS